MHAQSKFYKLPHGNGFDALEIHTLNDGDHLESGELLEFGDCFTLFGHVPGFGIEVIGEFETFEEACDVAEKLGGVV